MNARSLLRPFPALSARAAPRSHAHTHAQRTTLSLLWSLSPSSSSSSSPSLLLSHSSPLASALRVPLAPRGARTMATAVRKRKDTAADKGASKTVSDEEAISGLARMVASEGMYAGDMWAFPMDTLGAPRSPSSPPTSRACHRVIRALRASRCIFHVGR